MRTVLCALATVLALGSAAAADEIREASAYPIELGEVQGVAYYTVESDGLKVVATLEQTGGAAPVRVSTILAPGQTVTLSVPGATGAPAEEIAFVRSGDAIAINRPEPATN